MKNITKSFIKIFLIFLFAQRIFSQSIWEPDNNLNTTMRTYLNGSMGYDVTYDNYGLHMAAICQPSCNKQLNYFHFDNNGQKLDSIKNFESNVSGVCIGSYNGKVYLITIKEGVFKIYERVNGVSELQLKLSYDPEFYTGAGSENNYTNMSMTFLNNYIYFLWDKAGYTIPGVVYSDLMGFGRFNILTNTMETYIPPNFATIPEFPKFFNFPRIIALSNKLLAVYTYTQEGLANDTLFITQEISFDVNGTPVYGMFQGVKGWGNPPLGATYNGFQQTRANIQAVGGKIFLYTNLGYSYGGNPPYYIDNKFKIKLIEEEWNSNWEFTALNSKSFFKFPGLAFNPILNTVGFTYTSYSGIYNGNFIEYFISNSQLGSPQSLTQPGTQTLTGGALNNSIHGSYVIFDLDGGGSGRFVGIRRPSNLSGEINYNTLLTGNEYFNAPTPPYCRTNGADIEALANSTTRLKANTRVFIDEGDLIIFRANSCVIYETNAEIFPSERLIYETDCITWSNLACNRTYPGGLIQFNGGLNYTVNNGAFIVIDGNSTLEIADNTNLIFDCSNSFLKLLPTSNIKMGNNSSIKFINGAFMRSNGASFTGINTTSISNGLIFENSGIDSILNNTFSNAKTAITLKNSPSGSFSNRVIKSNTFNIPSGGDHKGIYGENNYNILIHDNVFNMPVTTQSGSPFYSGIFLKNSSTSGSGQGEAEPETETPYSLNIIHNTFNNGSGSVILANYTSNILPYYVRNNTFNSASILGLLGMKITGTIRDNVSSNYATPLGIHLVNSSPNLYNNTILSKDVSLHLIGNSYPNLSPYINGGQLVWAGGKNRFTTQRYDNVQLVHPANVYTDFGENRFTILDTTLTAYHIYGWLDTTITTYYARNNCWYPGNTAKIYLRHTLSGPPVPTVTGVTTIDCDREIDPNGWIEDHLGNGVIDSIMTSENNTGEVSSESDLIYEQAFNYMENSLYLDAVISFKELIDTDFEYEDLPKSAQYLYSCYEYLDTSFLQSERNTLFGNLKIYIEAKINSDDYKNEEFLDICFDIITMCEANLENYDAAANNYEFIALYHPDPDIRLNASWNYAEVQALINSGNGQSISNYKLQISNNDELKELRQLKRLSEIIESDPLMSKMKKSYEKANTERKEKITKQIQGENKSVEKIQNHLRISGELDKSKELKAKKNIFELKYLTDENLGEKKD